MPQVSKGERTQVSTRIEQRYFEKLESYLDITGETKNDFVRQLIIDQLDSIDLDDVEQNQERLPLSA